MTDWPTSSDFFWLSLGLLPIVYFIFRSLVVGFSELTSLGMIFIVSIWVGYHFTPWIAIPAGGWDSFLLRKEYITEGIRYATLIMFAFLIGYFVYLSLPKENMNKNFANKIYGNFSKIAMAQIQVSWIVLGSAMIFVVLLIKFGGISEFLSSTSMRGAGQFDERDFVGSLYRIINVFLAPASLILAFISSIYLAQSTTNTILVRLPLGLIGLITASLNSFHNFSRGSGFVFIILAIALILVRGRRGILWMLVLIMPTIYISMIGLTQRGEHMPGVGNFMSAIVAPNMDRLVDAILPDRASDVENEGWLEPTANPLNALDPWTTRAWTRESSEQDLVSAFVDFLQIIQPLPSEFVSWRSRAGESLSVVMGTWGSTGLTTPAMAEIYYLFGDVGLFVIVMFGGLAAWMEKKRIESNNLLSILMLASFFLACVIGLHGGLRAMTRPILYVIVVYALYEIYRKRRGHVQRSLVRRGNKIMPHRAMLSPRSNPIVRARILRRDSKQV